MGYVTSNFEGAQSEENREVWHIGLLCSVLHLEHSTKDCTTVFRVYQVSQQPDGPEDIINSIYQIKKLKYTLIKLLILHYKGLPASELGSLPTCLSTWPIVLRSGLSFLFSEAE